MDCTETPSPLASASDEEANAQPNEAQIRHFHEHGYVVLDRVVPPMLLAAMQAECDRNLQLQIEAMEQVGARTLGLSQRDRRYFLQDRYEESEALTDFLFGPLIRPIVRRLIGLDAYLFLDLFVVKAPREGTPFAWHQDGGYLMGRPHEPYVTLWCALDDMTEANGTLRVLPYERAPTRDVVPHIKDRASNDFVGYHGEDKGDAIAIAKGGIVVLASDLFHCSGSNITDAPRRAYLASISPEPVRDHNGALWNLAVPILRDGQPVVRE
jgi:ectoine hydroxylase-related dioxygenase (phytanoyl-CoA dioxygenase family)